MTNVKSGAVRMPFKIFAIVWQGYNGQDIKIEFDGKKGRRTLSFFSLWAIKWKVQNNTRIFYLKELGPCHWRVSMASISRIEYIDCARKRRYRKLPEDFTISWQRRRKSRGITRSARNFIYCNGPPLKFNSTYMHSGTTPGRIPHALTSVTSRIRIDRKLKHEVWHAFSRSRGFYQICNFH